uniref:F-box protein At4g22390-like n=1 Tax=Erigeron canadensis TaxID=72917 RepID=UPI001CB94662|nr:F-box protein At4g22390-like [Erigeron canadensis]
MSSSSSSYCSSTSNKRARRKKPLLLSATSNYNNIPEDVLLSSIFIRLRAKQLARMRSLSKTWNYVLSHPSFIQSHLDRNNNDEEILVVFYSGDFTPGEPFTAHPSTSPCEDLTNLIKPPDAPGCNTVIGSVHGLICFASFGFHPHSLRIWNPSLLAMIAPPPPYTCHTDIHDPEYAYDFRFGYDPKTSDYKVVKITYTVDSLDMIEELIHPVEVYSMRMDSWKQLTNSCNFPSHITCMCDPNEVYVDGYDGHVCSLALLY